MSIPALERLEEAGANGGVSVAVGMLNIPFIGDDGLSSLLPLGVPRGVDVEIAEGVIEVVEPLLLKGKILASAASFMKGVTDPLGVTEIVGVPTGVVAPELGGWGVEYGAGHTICLLKHS